MTDVHIEDEIIRTATEIGNASGYQDLFDAQLTYWLAVQALMRSGGYTAVRKRMGNISEAVAEALAGAKVSDIRQLCMAEISTIKPSLPDDSILSMLTAEEQPFSHARMVLQLLTDNREVQS